jgi:hypothetical protein
MPAYTTNNITSDRALVLLGQGVPPSIVAASIGVSESRISQLVSEPEFAAAVAELRYDAIQKHSTRDAKYDSIEDTLIDKLKDLIPLMMRPREVINAIQVINAAKRRGSSTPDAIIAQQTVINLTLPVQIIEHFRTNSQNHVIQAGAQELLTLQSSTLLTRTKEALATASISSPAVEEKGIRDDSTRAIGTGRPQQPLLQRAG